MEDVDIRYENGCIYMIQHKTDDTKEFYIGSSKDFKKRCIKHKSTCNNENSKGYNLKVYKYIRENCGWNEWTIIKLYDYPCKNKYKLELEEQRAIKEYKSTLNQFIPCRTYQEWYNDNKEKILQKGKEHYKNNRNKILKEKKEYHKANKEKISQQRKEHYENNKEKIKQQSKEHYETNKEEILKQRAIKINCDICNAIVSKHYIVEHKKSQKYKKYFKKN